MLLKDKDIDEIINKGIDRLENYNKQMGVGHGGDMVMQTVFVSTYVVEYLLFAKKVGYK